MPAILDITNLTANKPVLKLQKLILTYLGNELTNLKERYIFNICFSFSSFGF